MLRLMKNIFARPAVRFSQRPTGEIFPACRQFVDPEWSGIKQHENVLIRHVSCHAYGKMFNLSLWCLLASSKFDDDDKLFIYSESFCTFPFFCSGGNKSRLELEIICQVNDLRDIFCVVFWCWNKCYVCLTSLLWNLNVFFKDQ